MALFTQDQKKAIQPKIKEICKRHGIKATLSVRHHSTVQLNVASGSIDFDFEGNINTYHWERQFEGNEKAIAFLGEVLPVLNSGNYDESCIQTDYFNVGWYVDVYIGRWNKPYVLKGESS